MASQTPSIHGASFILDASEPSEVSTPEDRSAEDLELQGAVRAFIESDVVPRLDEIDALKPGLVPELLSQLGQLGFFMAEPTVENGGMDIGLRGTLGLMEELGRAGSFGVAAMVHQGIGTQPLAVYGTKAQRDRHLPALLSGRECAAYALTEPGSGSDALAMKTSALFDAAKGEWVLNGSKQFITNAAYASLFIAFARVEGDKVTAFLLPRQTPGLEVLAEEHKMGIRGSSTCPLRLTNVRLPKDAVLGEVGRGHKIAFNMLNLGRLKLGTTMLGANKRALAQATRYVNERHQFGRAISSFGMIRQKIADCAAQIFAGEAIAARTAGLIDEAVGQLRDVVGPEAAKQKAAEEFSIECAICKVYLTESATIIADHCVQMLGGYGYIEEYPAARNYRDVRVSRLYEGTNEINRITIVNTLMRRAGRGDFGSSFFRRLQDLRPLTFDSGDGAPLMQLFLQMEHLRGVLSRVVTSLLDRFGDPSALKDEEEHTQCLADVIIELFVAESALLRAIKARKRAAPALVPLIEALAHSSVMRSARSIRRNAEASLALALPEGEGGDAIGSVHRATAFAADFLRFDRIVAEAVIANGGEIPTLAGPPGT